MITLIENDKPEVSILYKIKHNKHLSKKDFEKVYKILTPHLAYRLAKYYKKANIEKCQDICFQDPWYAYVFDMSIKIH